MPISIPKQDSELQHMKRKTLYNIVVEILLEILWWGGKKGFTAKSKQLIKILKE